MPEQVVIFVMIFFIGAIICVLWKTIQQFIKG